MSDFHVFTRFLDSVCGIVASHFIGRPGAYRRWHWQNPKNDRGLGLHPYGSADAANTRYTIGHFPEAPAERAGWVAKLRGLQDAQTLALKLCQEHA